MQFPFNQAANMIDPALLQKLSFYEGRLNLTLEEIEFMELRMVPNKGYAFGVLPYLTETEMRLSDSIARKLNLNRFYRGPRFRSGRRGSICRTLKEHAVAVALYTKPR